MNNKEKTLTMILAVLLVIFALVALYLNVLSPRGGQSSVNTYKPVVKEKPIELNNTLKTSVTVLPAADAPAVKP